MLGTKIAHTAKKGMLCVKLCPADAVTGLMAGKRRRPWLKAAF
jgi:hypothetical protein